MYCPVCTDKRLTSLRLEEHLKAQHCTSCEGHWIARTHYDAWTDKHDAAATPFDDVALDTHDVAHAKICPECARIMGRFKVGHGVDFFLDRCSACGGVWLDHHEWIALKKHKLHTQVNRIFSTQWERETRESGIAERLDALYGDRFGDDTYAEMKRIREWLLQHPKRLHLIAFLRDDDPYKI